MLSSTVWGGISGLAALITLAIMIYDRKSTRHPDTLRTFLQMCGFFVLGSLYTPILMTLAALLGDCLALIGVQPLGGHFGELGIRLGLVRLGPWGFNLEQSVLSVQLGALTLWIGGVGAGMAGVIFGYMVNYDLKKVDRAWLIIPFFSVVFTILIGTMNLVANNV